MWTKKFLFGIVFIFLISNISYSQSGWVTQNPLPIGNVDGARTYFINNSTGWLFGDRVLYKTTDGAQTWKIQILNNNVNITNLLFLNESTGFGVGGRNIFLKTTNGGTNWEIKTLEVTGSYSFNHLSFFDNLTGYITGNDRSSFLKTTNGGENWTNISAFPFSTLSAFCFFNASTGLAFSSGVYKTTNGGSNWSTINQGTSFYNAQFLDINTGFAYNGSNILKTTNGGINWTSVNSVSFSTDLKFINNQTGFVTSTGSVVLKTSNGGLNWSTLVLPISFDGYNSISTIDANIVYASGNKGEFVKSTNGGINWINYRTSITRGSLGNVSAINENIAFISMINNIFLKTTNGGSNWLLKTIANLGTVSINSIYFLNELTGWAATHENRILKTTNGGENWEAQLSPQPTYTYYNKLFFLNNQTGWVTGYDCIVRTTNGGTTWLNGISGTNINFREINFGNANTGWAVGSYQQNDTLMKTTNGGINWFPSTSFRHVGDIFFLNENTGWISDVGRISRTTNAGVSWSESFPLSNIYAVYKSIKFINSMIGFAISQESGGIYRVVKTINGGINWQESHTLTGYLSYISMTNENVGWIAGSEGTILKTTTGGNVFISQISTEVPEKYSLHQNYPNPFNPSTNIKFDIHKSGIASLKVFDLLSKEMETLVDEQLSVGTYEVTFNASSLPSGIYFYVLKTGDFVESKKMMLVK